MIMDVNSADKHIGDARRPPDGAEAHPAWIDSRSIFGDRNEVVIRHGDQIYRLRITRLGKLILNK